MVPSKPYRKTFDMIASSIQAKCRGATQSSSLGGLEDNRGARSLGSESPMGDGGGSSESGRLPEPSRLVVEMLDAIEAFVNFSIL